MFRGVALLEQELMERVAARASGHVYASLREELELIILVCPLN